MSHRIRDIEVLRGYAVLGVVLYHAHDNLVTWPVPVWDRVVAGYVDFWPGVDLFFAISGFVIARTLLPALRATDGSAEFFRQTIVFWIRRAFRLLPSGWFWLAAILIACVLYNRTFIFGGFHTNLESALSAMLSLANVREADAFLNHYGFGPISPYWSLSLEEQFYFSLPVVAFLAGRFLVPVLWLAVLFVFTRPETPWLMMFRVHAILLGVLLAEFSHTPVYALTAPTALTRSGLARFATTALLLGAIAALAPIGQHIAPFKIAIIAVLSAALVLLASHNRDVIWPGGLPRRIMLWVGTRSYAIYLIHVPALCLVHETWARLMPRAPRASDGPLLALGFAAILAALSEANYRLLELPFRRRGLRVASQLLHEPFAARPRTA